MIPRSLRTAVVRARDFALAALGCGLGAAMAFVAFSLALSFCLLALGLGAVLLVIPLGLTLADLTARRFAASR